jgi:ABC-type multidrug transport system ATPase subunit
VNLGRSRKRKVKSYSGGHSGNGSALRRRSPGSPRLLIVDEPTAGLDPEERLRLHHLLAGAREDRTGHSSPPTSSRTSPCCAALRR